MKKPLDKEFVALIIDLYSQFRAIMKLGDPMSQKIVIRDFNALQGQIQEYLAKEDITQDALQQALTKADPEFKAPLLSSIILYKILLNLLQRQKPVV